MNDQQSVARTDEVLASCTIAWKSSNMVSIGSSETGHADLPDTTVHDAHPVITDLYHHVVKLQRQVIL